MALLRHTPKANVGFAAQDLYGAIGVKVGAHPGNADHSFDIRPSAGFTFFQVLIRPSTSGFTTLVGLPAAYATIWSKISENWVSYSSRVT